MSINKTNISLAVAFLFLALYNPLAILAERFNSDAFLGSLTVYGVYRTIDRFVSFVADINLQGGVVVAYVVASPGKILQPAVQALDRFIDVLFPFMLLSGILSMVIVPLAKIGALIGFIGVALRVAGKRFFRTNKTFSVTSHLSDALVKIAIISALIVPGSYSAGYAIGNWMTSSAWEEAYSKFTGFAAETGLESTALDPLGEAGPTTTQNDDVPITQEDGSVLSGLSDWVQEKAGAVVDRSHAVVAIASGEALDMLSKASSIAGALWGVVDASTKLLAAYIIKTAIFPILTGWILIWTIRQVSPRALKHTTDLDLEPGLLPKRDQITS